MFGFIHYVFWANTKLFGNSLVAIVVKHLREADVNFVVLIEDHLIRQQRKERERERGWQGETFFIHHYSSQ